MHVFLEEPLTVEEKSTIERALDGLRSDLIEGWFKDDVKDGHILTGRALKVSDDIHSLQSKVWKL